MKYRYCTFVLMVVLAGCTSPNHATVPVPAPTAAATMKPDTRVRGRIKSVNQQAQYAIVDFGLGTVPRLGSEMNVYRGNDVTGVLRLTGPARQNIVAGDIISGEAQAGDEAIWDKPTDKKKDAPDRPEE